MFTRSTWIVLIAALAAGLGLWSGQRYFSPHAAVSGRAALALSAVRLFPQPRALPAFSLQQSDGSALTPEELQGHWTLVFLGFSHCPDVCPTTLSDLAQAQKQWATLPAASRPRLLFVSVDPERDSPKQAGDYAAFFHADTLAATAAEPALTAFASGLGLVYMKVAMDNGGRSSASCARGTGTSLCGDYSMDHSSALVVIDPQGRQAGLIRPPLVPAAIARDLLLLTASP